MQAASGAVAAATWRARPRDRELFVVYTQLQHGRPPTRLEYECDRRRLPRN